MQIKIENCDAFDGIKQIADNSVNLIITDPPYIIPSMDGFEEFGNKCFSKELKNKPQNFFEGYDIAKMHEEFVRIQPFLNLYIFCNIKLLKELICFYKDYSLDILVWHKPNAIPACNLHYMRDLEYCVYICENRKYLFNSVATSSKLHQENCQHYKETTHPTEKPLRFIERLLCNSSKKGDLVCDPFSGSGTTAIACKTHDRNFIGFEIDRDYYEMSLNRLKQGVIKPLFEM